MLRSKIEWQTNRGSCLMMMTKRAIKSDVGHRNGNGYRLGRRPEPNRPTAKHLSDLGWRGLLDPIVMVLHHPVEFWVLMGRSGHIHMVCQGQRFSLRYEGHCLGGGGEVQRGHDNAGWGRWRWGDGQGNLNLGEVELLFVVMVIFVYGIGTTKTMIRKVNVSSVYTIPVCLPYLLDFSGKSILFMISFLNVRLTVNVLSWCDVRCLSRCPFEFDILATYIGKWCEHVQSEK